MIVDNNCSKYIVDSGATLSVASKKLVHSKEGILLCVSHSRKLIGVLTKGDILRILSQEDFSVDRPVESYLNKNFCYLNESGVYLKDNDVDGLLERFAYIPVIDDNGHLKSVLRRKKDNESFSIGEFQISKTSPSFIIAEIGNNHNGDINLAKKLVQLVKNSGADCAKFQMRDMNSLYLKSKAGNLGEEYVLDLLRRFQLTDEELFEVFDYCKEIGIMPLCTPWDVSSLEKLEHYGMPAYKVSSADLTNHEFLVKIARTGKVMICSTGMASDDEINESISLLNSCGAKYVLLHCNSTYPTPYSDINLRYLKTLEKMSHGIVGYSGHERGRDVPIAAVALGAKVIEKHFTIDRSMEGNDHKVSLLPSEFKSMVDSIRNVEMSMGQGDYRQISQGEMMNRVTLAKSLIVNCDLKKGEEIQSFMIDTKSPGKGLQPNKKNQLIGKRLKRDMKKGDFFYPSDLVESTIAARDYNFPILWGVPVRYHDFLRIIQKCPEMEFVEFHLSYKDLEVDIDSTFNEEFPHQFVVHSPELFFGDHVLDLCSDDEDYREHSIAELRKVIEITKKLKKYFPKTSRPQIVVNVGGFTNDSPLSKNERVKLYDKLIESLAFIDTDGVELIPQTMPPFPWHMGGQQFHNLFVDPDEIVEFCNKTGLRICFDVSHSGLACNHNSYSFSDFVDKVMPYTAHLHIADAFGHDGEGLQVGEGDLDFKYLFRQVREGMTFIPEIWQGHENDGEGFWVALDRLEALLK